MSAKQILERLRAEGPKTSDYDIDADPTMKKLEAKEKASRLLSDRPKKKLKV